MLCKTAFLKCQCNLCTGKGWNPCPEQRHLLSVRPLRGPQVKSWIQGVDTPTPSPERREDQSDVQEFQDLVQDIRNILSLSHSGGQSQQNTKSLRFLQDRKLKKVLSSHKPWTAPPQSRIAHATEGHMFPAYQAQLSARSNESKEQHLTQTQKQMLSERCFCSTSTTVLGKVKLLEEGEYSPLTKAVTESEAHSSNTDVGLQKMGWGGGGCVCVRYAYEREWKFPDRCF